MSDVFSDIISNLEAAGAFNEVMNVPGVFPGYRHTEFQAGQDTYVINHRARILGFDIYSPMKDVIQFSRSWITEAVQRPLSKSVVDVLKSQLNKIYIDDGERQELILRGYDKGELNREPGMGTLIEKCGMHENDFLAEMFRHHPELFASVVMMQAANIEFLAKVRAALNSNRNISKQQRAIAKEAIESLTVDYQNGEFVEGPVLWIAISYHDRITKNRTIPADYSLPLTQDDFAQGWDKTLNKGGMIVKDARAPKGKDYGRVCPWIKRAGVTSNEVCAADAEGEGKRTAGMGFGSWCVYQMLNKPEAKRMHARDYAYLQNPYNVNSRAKELRFVAFLKRLTRS